MSATPAAPSPFPRRLTAWLGAVAAVCMIGSIVLAIVTTETPPEPRRGAASTSASALGHAAFAELLRATGVEVIVTRRATAARTAEASLLLLIEPLVETDDKDIDDLSDLVRRSQCPVLVVLPKWREEGLPGQGPLVGPRAASQIEEVLRAMDPAARLDPVSTIVWDRNELDAAPTIEHDPQLASAPGWRPIVAMGRRFLAAERGSGADTVAILTDPDVLANHGLHHEDNAAFVLDLVWRLRSDGRPVVLDETLHGLGVAESFWAQLFRFPLVLATAQAALAAALFLWAGMRRFGPPVPASPPFEPGKAFLIDHAAGLLDAWRHHGEAVARYAAFTIEDAARRLHTESERPADVRARLAALERRKKVTQTIAFLEAEAAALKQRADARDALALAGRLDRWKQEMLDGSQVGSGSR